MDYSCGLLFVFSGPSGSGKNTIMDELKQDDPDLIQLPTATTRCRRENEVQGREHEFLSLSEFRERILDRSLIEWQIIHNESVYGVPRKTIQNAIREGQKLIADVDVLGATRLKEEFGDYVVLIFVEPPDRATLEKRLRARPDVESETELQTRLHRSEFEMSFASQYDYRIINIDNHLQNSVDEAKAIIKARCAGSPVDLQEIPGWAPENIVQSVSGVVLHNEQILLIDDDLPRITVPGGQLPFEALRNYMRDTLGISIVPARPDSTNRLVDIVFEAPQVVDNLHENERIYQNMIYVVHPEILNETLPDGAHWHPVHTPSLDSRIKNLLTGIQVMA